jgi:hypothetical protein
MAEAVADVIGDGRASGDAGELLFQPWLQIVRERFAACLSFGTAFIRRSAADISLDLIELGDACERFLRDRRIAAFGDVVEAAPKMRPAEGERQRTAGAPGVGERLVGGIAVDPRLRGDRLWSTPLKPARWWMACSAPRPGA